MSRTGTGAPSKASTGMQRIFTGTARVLRAWRVLPYERRLAVAGALALFLTLFLPWYQETVIASGTPTKLRSASASVTGWGAFSFVEAAVLLVAISVLVLLFHRAEGRAFHLPGGDGGVIALAGAWTCCLVVWRIFDKQGTSNHNQFATTSGIEWGIFVALAGAVCLTYAGNRIRVAHRPEPPLPGEDAAGEPQPEEPRPEEPRGTRVKRAPGAPTTGPAAQSPGAKPRPTGWLTAPPQDRDERETMRIRRAASGASGPAEADSEPESKSWSFSDDYPEPPEFEPGSRRSDEQLTIRFDGEDGGVRPPQPPAGWSTNEK